MSPGAEGVLCIKKIIGCIDIIRHFFNEINKVFKLMAMIQFKKIIFYQIVKRISQDIPFLVGKTVRT